MADGLCQGMQFMAFILQGGGNGLTGRCQRTPGERLVCLNGVNKIFALMPQLRLMLGQLFIAVRFFRGLFKFDDLQIITQLVHLVGALIRHR